jgi:hypothetical protein
MEGGGVGWGAGTHRQIGNRALISIGRVTLERQGLNRKGSHRINSIVSATTASYQQAQGSTVNSIGLVVTREGFVWRPGWLAGRTSGGGQRAGRRGGHGVRVGGGEVGGIWADWAREQQRASQRTSAISCAGEGASLGTRRPKRCERPGWGMGRNRDDQTGSDGGGGGGGFTKNAPGGGVQAGGRPRPCALACKRGAARGWAGRSPWAAGAAAGC